MLVHEGLQLGPRATPPGPATYIGVTVGAIGLVGAVAGGVLLTNADEIRRYGPAGFALLSAGLTSLASGMTLVVVDVWVLAPHRAANKTRLELSYAGLSF